MRGCFVILSSQERGRALLLGELYTQAFRVKAYPPKAFEDFCAFAAR